MDNKQYLEELRLLGEEVQQLQEKNCPTNPSKWSYYKSQAKKKFDVYPSAYANGWASKQYKAAGGGWKQCAGESMENTNENFAVHMMVAKAIADQKVKNPETKKDVRVTTALKDKQHPAHGKAKSLVQRLKDKFSKKENIEEGYGDWVNEEFKSKDNTFEKVYGIFDKKDYFNAKGLAKTQIGNFERALQRNDKGAQEILDKFKGDMNKAKEYIIQVISDQKKAHAFEDYKALKGAIDSIQKGKPEQGAVNYVKRIIHNNNQKYSIALYSELRGKKFNNYKDIHADVDSLIGESVNEGISVFDERHFGKNGLIIMIDDNGKKVSAIFKNKKNSYKYDRNNPAHIKKLLDLAKKTKYPNAIDESVNEGKKRFRQQNGIGKSKYTISYHDGKKKHKDGSDFFDIQIFKNQKDVDTFRKSLLSKGYVEESVNEAQKVNPTSNKFLKGMKKIKVKGLGGYMPGVDYVYVDGDKYYFVDTDGDHMELKNTATIKQLHKLHGSSLGESINEAASRTAMEIGGLTGMNKEAIQKIVDDNKLDIEKVYQYVKNGKLPERMALVSAIAGKPGNAVQTKLIKKFK